MTYKLKELCLEVTDTCVMQCRHCSSCSGKYGTDMPNHMPIAQAKQIVKELSELGGKILEISGGEPLLYPGLHDLCRYASNLDLEVRVYTSGVHPTFEKRLQELDSTEIEGLKRVGVNRIIFNLEGASSGTHEKITGVAGTHDLVIKSLRNAKAAELWTGVHFVPMKPNFRELPKVAGLCSALGVNELALLRFVPQGRGRTNRKWLELSQAQFEEVLCSAANLMKEYTELNIRVGCPMDFLSFIEPSLEPHRCKAGRCTCVISPNGEVLPCPGFKNAHEFVAGDVNVEPLNAIWQKGFRTLREFKPAEISGSCHDCDFLTVCGGRCAAQRAIAYGSIYKGPDPACPKRNAEEVTNEADCPSEDLVELGNY
jgi:radical SAM protein with 4Fe4S-binding SPASM domain